MNRWWSRATRMSRAMVVWWSSIAVVSLGFGDYRKALNGVLLAGLFWFASAFQADLRESRVALRLSQEALREARSEIRRLQVKRWM